MPLAIPTFLTRKQITAQVRTMDLPADFIFNRWFPIQGVDSDEFESLVTLDQMQLAPFVNIDAETPVMPDDITGSYMWSVAYIRFKKRFKESDLRIFHEPGVTDPNTLTAATARAREAKIRRYVDALSTSIDARLEWMFANAIAGSIAYNDMHVAYTLTYDGAFIGSNRFTPAITWENTNAVPVTNLSNWVEQLSDEANHDRWIMVASRNVLGAMARSSEVRQAWAVNVSNPAATAPPSLNPIGMAGVQANSTSTAQILEGLRLIGIDGVISYNTRYSTDATGSAFNVSRPRFRFTDSRDIFLLPAGMVLGRMATAPAAPNDYRTGKFGWSESRQDPWVVEVGAGMYSFIDFPGVNWNKVAQARVLP